MGELSESAEKLLRELVKKKVRGEELDDRETHDLRHLLETAPYDLQGELLTLLKS